MYPYSWTSVISSNENWTLKINTTMKLKSNFNHTKTCNNHKNAKINVSQLLKKRENNHKNVQYPKSSINNKLECNVYEMMTNQRDKLKKN